MEILSVKNLNFTYSGSAYPTLSDINFTVNKGEFITLAGDTGSGKSTLLRVLKRELRPRGEISGEIRFFEKNEEDLSDRDTSSMIGFVLQYPDHQIVTDKVWHELAFGLENLGLNSDTIRLRVSEMAAYFGIEDWFESRVSSLSGGQKQLLNLAAVMVMQPDILLLDEPTAQLDPVAASDFIATLKKLNRDLGLTIILAEHRLEEAVVSCDRLMVLKEGRIRAFESPASAARNLKKEDDLLLSMPSAVQLYHRFDIKDSCPLSVREGSDFIEKHFNDHIKELPEAVSSSREKCALELKDVVFRYERGQEDVIKSLNLKVFEKEIFCILGGNGSGKSTALLLASGIRKPYRGKVKIFEKTLESYKNQSLYNGVVSLLPQDVQTLFLKNTVKEELEDVHLHPSDTPFDFSHLLNRHPYDLSGGEMQLLGLMKVIASDPDLVLLDEPTKGLDPKNKKIMADLLKNMKEKGKTIVMVSHDVEFAASVSDRAALLFRGDIVSSGTPGSFFNDNYFYTTGINRMMRGKYKGIINLDQAEMILKMNGEKNDRYSR